MERKEANYFYRKNLKFLRKQMKLTQTELGNKLGVTFSAISRWEKGDNDINIAIATKMAKVFDVQVYHFIYTDLENFDGVYRPFKPLFEEIKITTEEERQLIINYRQLDDDHKERLAEIIKFYLNEQN